MHKKIPLVLTVLLFLVTSLSAQSIYELNSNTLPREGQVIGGFQVAKVSDFDMLGAEVFEFTHIRTGAKVMYVANGDQ